MLVQTLRLILRADRTMVGYFAYHSCALDEILVEIHLGGHPMYQKKHTNSDEYH